MTSCSSHLCVTGQPECSVLKMHPHFVGNSIRKCIGDIILSLLRVKVLYFMDGDGE